MRNAPRADAGGPGHASVASDGAASSPAAGSQARSMLTSALALTLIATPLIVGGAAWLRGGSGALSALVGCAVAIGFFVIGHFGVTAVVGGVPAMSIAGAFVVYLGQLIVLAFVILVLRKAGWLDGRAFAASAIIATVIWQIGQVRGFRKARHEVYPDVTLPTVTS